MSTGGSRIPISYVRFYSLSGVPEIAPQSFKAYRCVIPNVTPSEFHICYTGIPKPARPPAFAGRKVGVEAE